LQVVKFDVHNAALLVVESD